MSKKLKSKKYKKIDCTVGNPSLELDKKIEQYKRIERLSKEFTGCIEPSKVSEYLKNRFIK